MTQINLIQLHKIFATFEKDRVAAVIFKNRLVHAIKIMYRNYVTRKHLATLTEKELVDVSISRDEARKEIAKKFWQ